MTFSDQSGSAHYWTCNVCWERESGGEKPPNVVALEEALRECARLSGADLSGGFPMWPDLPTFAVQEVRQLRKDYDEACEEVGRLAFDEDDRG